MAREHLSHDEFFTGLASLLESHQKSGHGSVFLTQKRLSYDRFPPPSPTKIADDPLWDTRPPEPLPIVVRATDGKSRTKDLKKNAAKVKLSTIVEPNQMDDFFARYAETCKGGIQSLKKRDRSKRKKTKKGKAEKKA
ncbi:signal recognition particle, SRP9/SRP14 subunit [Myriangium duriaei CBS 260.36]|uniref:Signal recognition particle subunit SRP14 n=1 Tax=Myriangium duriaei CBS 260.36 TaxID=1168546 RepID=A0A9P4JFI7_9PEZI|nr:signal recognition particle, SRP9/SRP14 subunit [Myriangium duriaei CBS 260.36]